MERVTVGQIAEATGVHANTIRRYADKGYIKAKRDFLGVRFFPDPDATIARVKGLLNGDITLDDIRK